MRGAVTVLLLNLIGAHTASAAAQAVAAPLPIVLRYAVLLERGADTVPIVAVWARWGCERVFLAPPIAAVKCPIARTDSLGKLPGVKEVMFDELVPLPDPDILPAMMGEVPDAPLALPWPLTTIGADTAWDRGITGAGVRVGIMDSGIFAGHPHLNVVGGRNFGAGNGGPEAWGDTFAPCKGHGTHVAGSVGSSVHGVAPGVELVALRVFENIGGDCLAWTSTQLAALTWAQGEGVEVVNASIGGSSWVAYMSQAVADYVVAGGVMVASSGNGGGTTALFPARYVGAISVGAVTSSGARASYSNRDPDLDLVAPGSGIVSSMPSGGTGSKSGTSMASPHVAGVVALLRQLRPALSPDSITALLHASARDFGAVGPDPDYGRGRVDVPRLLALVIPRAPLISPPDATPVGVTQCIPVASAVPWTATTTGAIAVWQSGSSLCWRGDVAGSFTIRLRSI